MNKLLAAAAFGLLCMLPATSDAATQTTGQKGISISPVIQSLSTAGFEPVKDFNVTVQNQTGGSRKFEVEIADFEAQGERGGISILPEKTNSFSERGLRAWMTVDQNAFTLKSGEKKTLTVSIDNNPNLLPGGHYGAILVSQVDENKRSNKNTVNTNPTVSSLVFLTKIGGESYDLRLKQVEAARSIWHYPKTAELRFYNPGNTPVVPRGTVTLKTGQNNVFARGVINDDSAMVLPSSYRRIEVTLSNISSAGSGPREYTLETNYRYDGIAEFATVSQKHFFLDLPFILLLTGVLIGLYCVLRSKLPSQLWKKIRKP